MRVNASVNFPIPGVVWEVMPFDSVAAVMDEFYCLRETAQRFGEVMPEAQVYHPECSDYPMFCLSVGPRGGIVRTRG